MITGDCRTRNWRRDFVRVPWSWIDRLTAASRGSTYRLALLLLYEHWRGGAQPIKVSNVKVAGDGLSRGSKARALRELERLGLVRVERRSRKSPWVTVLIPKS